MAETTELLIHGVMTPVIQLGITAGEAEDPIRAEIATSTALEAASRAEDAATRAENIAGGGVYSFNKRAGHVIPMKGDYTPAMIGAAASDLSNVTDEAMLAKMEASGFTGGGIVSNPNLLDNWYFANPIDQQGGLVTTPETLAYQEESLTTLIGDIGGYNTVIPVSSTVGKCAVGSSYLYVALSDCVRGYVGGGYTIDRWKKDVNGTIIVLDDCIEHHGTSYGFYEIIEPDVLKAISGKVCTMSALVRSPNGGQVQLGVGGGGGYVAATLSEEWTIVSRQFVYDYENYPNRNNFVLRAGVNDGNEHIVQYKAAKLELGSEQTLAHQDENGNWVLNDSPPNKQQELAKCQRYQMPLQAEARYAALTSSSGTGGRYFVPTPTTMRGNPTIVDAVFRLIVGGTPVTLDGSKITGCTVLANGIEVLFSGLSGLGSLQPAIVFVSTAGMLDVNL